MLELLLRWGQGDRLERAPVSRTVSREDLLARVRETAIENGSAWLRPYLDRYGVERLSDLPNDALTGMLA